MSDRQTGHRHVRHGRGRPTPNGDGPQPPAEEQRPDPTGSRHPSGTRPISLTGPSWRDRLDTYRSWPLWVRLAAPAVAAALVLAVVAVSLLGGSGGDQTTLATGQAGRGTVTILPDDSTTVTGPPGGTETATGNETATPGAGDPGGPATPSTPSTPVDPAPPGGPGQGRVPAAPGIGDDAPAADDPGAQCHPSYEPCVPMASDVDCLDSGDDGPAYTGRVRVVGPDDYDLDEDGDGIACAARGNRAVPPVDDEAATTDAGPQLASDPTPPGATVSEAPPPRAAVTPAATNPRGGGAPPASSSPARSGAGGAESPPAGAATRRHGAGAAAR
jgi:hypothetical protein